MTQDDSPRQAATVEALNTRITALEAEARGLISGDYVG